MGGPIQCMERRGALPEMRSTLTALPGAADLRRSGGSYPSCPALPCPHTPWQYESVIVQVRHIGQ